MSPETINTNQNEACGKAIHALKQAGELETCVDYRQVKHLNNRLEADHGAPKRVINPVRGFKTQATASATIKGFKDLMRMIRKRQRLIVGQAFASKLADQLGTNPKWLPSDERGEYPQTSSGAKWQALRKRQQKDFAALCARLLGLCSGSIFWNYERHAG